MTWRRMTAAALLAGSAMALPGPAFAQSNTADLERRVDQLEAMLRQLQGDLADARERAAAAEARSSAAVAKVEAAAAPPPPAKAPDGFTIGGGATTVKIGGFIKTVATMSRWDDGDVAANSFGRDFYLPSAIPVGGTRESTDTDFSAKQTRLSLSLETPLGGKMLKGYLETDFQTAPGAQGSERTTNGYNMALRRAYLQYQKLTIGQDWTTFQYVGALPESTDFVGATEGTVFVRQPLVRWSQPLSKLATLHLSVENPESATAVAGSPALTEQDDDKVPDFAARLALAPKFGELSLAFLLRQISVDTATQKTNQSGWGVSGGGKIFLNPAKSSDFRFMATYGQGIGRYVGLNFAPDAIYTAAADRLDTVKVFAGLGAFRLSLTDKLRLNVIGSYQNVDYPGGFAVGAFNSFNQTAWSGAINLFYSPIKPLDLGFEYRHGERELVSGLEGQLDRFEFAARYSF